ncbi:MAG: hypothetical protein PHD45_01600 [Bacteroidales bacterium]|nr:hypothetical protein [Bacteroidales bacterium]
MKKLFLIAVVIISVSFISCEDEKDYNQVKQPTTLQSKAINNLINNDAVFTFTSNSKISDCYDLMSAVFKLFPNSFLIAKSSKDPLTYDYGFGRLKNELGKEITEELKNGSIYFAPSFIKVDKDISNAWLKEEIEKGNYVILTYDKATKEQKRISIRRDK